MCLLKASAVYLQRKPDSSQKITVNPFSANIPIDLPVTGRSRF
jgi:hypothetical protein